MFKYHEHETFKGGHNPSLNISQNQKLNLEEEVHFFFQSLRSPRQISVTGLIREICKRQTSSIIEFCKRCDFNQ